MGGIAITGIAETTPTRRADKGLHELVVEAALAACADAGIGPEEIDGIVTDGVVMPTTVPHDFVAAQLGASRGFDAALSYGGAGTTAAPMLAEMAIASGRATNVLCYFGVDWGTRTGGPYAFHDLYPAKLAYEKPYGFNAQPTYFALWARRYMHELGLREEHLAALCVAQRENALAHGGGQTSAPLTRDDYFASRMIAEPLRVPDCCLISDGAGAFVMTSRERALDAPRPPVHVLATGYAAEPTSGEDVFTQGPDLLTLPAVRAAADQALGRAGIGIGDVDFAEVYDCFSISCLMQIEDLGFCAKGEAGPLALAGETRIGGRLPVNTHGGLMSYSYLLGVEHVIEAVRQLRGDGGGAQVAGAEIGLVGGLSPPDYGVLVLGR